MAKQRHQIGDEASPIICVGISHGVPYTFLCGEYANLHLDLRAARPDHLSGPDLTALTAAEMFHDGSGVFDALNVFIDVNILVRRM
jgi:hypothetical protein